MIDPALHHGETGERQRKIRIELDGLFEKRYGLQRRVAKHVPPRCVIVRLNEKQIRVGIFGWPLIKPRFFVWRQFRLKGRGNFLREVGLNREDVGQIAIVIFRPNVLVVIRIDQLHVHSDAITNPPHTAFQQRRNASALPISRALRTASPRYDITDMREMTFRSPIFERFVRISSWMPSAK